MKYVLLRVFRNVSVSVDGKDWFCYTVIMVILGIDPGYGIVGFGLIDYDGRNAVPIDYGVIETSKHETLPVRLHQIADDLKKIIHRYQPEAVAIEELFFYNNKTTAIAVAEARGVILLTAIEQCGNLFEYTPMQIKQAITGYGRAEKRQVQEMVKWMLKLEKIPRPDDAADALAVALTHAYTNRFSKAVFQVR